MNFKVINIKFYKYNLIKYGSTITKYYIIQQRPIHGQQWLPPDPQVIQLARPGEGIHIRALGGA